jgi:hypothetical protein
MMGPGQHRTRNAITVLFNISPTLEAFHQNSSDIILNKFFVHFFRQVPNTNLTNRVIVIINKNFRLVSKVVSTIFLEFLGWLLRALRTLTKERI